MRTLIAVLVALAAGSAMRHHTRPMLDDGTTLEEGGGWTAVVLIEFLVAMGAVGVALS